MARLRNQAAHDCIGAQLEEAAATYSQASDMLERTKVTPDRFQARLHRERPASP